MKPKGNYIQKDPMLVATSFGRLRDRAQGTASSGTSSTLSSLSLRRLELVERSKRTPRSPRPSHPTLGPLTIRIFLYVIPKRSSRLRHLQRYGCPLRGMIGLTILLGRHSCGSRNPDRNAGSRSHPLAGLTCLAISSPRSRSTTARSY